MICKSGWMIGQDDNSVSVSNVLLLGWHFVHSLLELNQWRLLMATAQRLTPSRLLPLYTSLMSRVASTVHNVHLIKYVKWANSILWTISQFLRKLTGPIFRAIFFRKEIVISLTLLRKPQNEPKLPLQQRSTCCHFSWLLKALIYFLKELPKSALCAVTRSICCSFLTL